MKSVRIAIIGGGLSGLHAAWRLERQGVHDYVVLEARNDLGGRIASVDGSGRSAPYLAGDPGQFDLGPTWFWPDYQRQLHRLVEELGLERFAQFDSGDTVVENSPTAPPLRMRGYMNSPTSMRLVGGMRALVNALRADVDPARIMTGQVVSSLRREKDFVDLTAVDAAGRTCSWRAEHVLLALPPRLAVQTIEFEPPLPPALADEWNSTPTWMAAQAKYVAVYDTPFWREQGLSGEGRSRSGPMVEIHDASMPGGSAALFGFIGIPANARRAVDDDVMRALCRAQLVRMFGPEAAALRADVVKDWAWEPYTAVPADLAGEAQHGAPPSSMASSGAWHGRLIGIASEWSPQFPGYVAGAIEAAELGVKAMVSAKAESSGRTATAPQA
ncbi:Putrescine oxidase [Achromobacter xylosoxidans]|uniref:flavin monoamine oxidase family protein n=1 Tax=Alcaligenes xylosoxydans xylosoxydans TaxID=85698 RepID=UPI0012A7A7C5|nr:FAD-dependent oxidoreductase [Achromobacter xylosoxidans]CUR72898.1 Putrescine oxidase [Achromobacter xylosoxidans]